MFAVLDYTNPILYQYYYPYPRENSLAFKALKGLPENKQIHTFKNVYEKYCELALDSEEYDYKPLYNYIFMGMDNKVAFENYHWNYAIYANKSITFIDCAFKSFIYVYYVNCKANIAVSSAYHKTGKGKCVYASSVAIPIAEIESHFPMYIINSYLERCFKFLVPAVR